MVDENVPTGSVPLKCPECLYKEGWDIYEAVTDVGRSVERFYAVCRHCGHVLPLRLKGESAR
jgi:hypothetical protein